MLAETDTAFLTMVKTERHWRCQRCDFPGTDAHHIIGRTNMAVRYSPLNIDVLCAECHRWAHANPLEYNMEIAFRVDLAQLHVMALNLEHGRWVKRHLKELQQQFQGALHG